MSNGVCGLWVSTVNHIKSRFNNLSFDFINVGSVVFSALLERKHIFPARRPTSCSWLFREERGGLLGVRFGEGEAGCRGSSSAGSEPDMASPGLSPSPAPEKTTITLGRGSVRLSWMKRLTRVVAAGSGLKDGDWRSRPQPPEPLEALDPFCCMHSAGQLSAPDAA